MGTHLALNSNTLQLIDSQGNILSNVNFNVSNISNLQKVLDDKLDNPTMTTNKVGKWNGNNFVDGLLQDNGNVAGVGNIDYKNVVWAVDSPNKAALISPRMTEIQRFSIVLDNTQSGAVVYQTDQKAGYYLWNGTSWQSLGENISTTDLTNIQPRTFTQNANFSWDTSGNPYYLKGLTDQTENSKQYNKVLRIDPVTNQIAMGVSSEISVTIPDNLPNPATPSAQTLNILHTYTNTPTALNTNVADLNDFIMNIGDFQFTRLTAEDWNVVNATNNDSSYVDKNSGIVLKCLNPGAFSNRQVMACAYPNLVLPSNKNWVFTIGCTVGTYYASHMGIVGIGISNATTNIGMLQSFLSSLSAGWDQYNSLNFIENNDRTTPAENGFEKVNNNTLIFTKVGNILNTTVRSGSYYKSLNIDVTGINSFKPLLNLVKKSWDDPTNSCTSDFGMYYIQP